MLTVLLSYSVLIDFCLMHTVMLVQPHRQKSQAKDACRASWLITFELFKVCPDS